MNFNSQYLLYLYGNKNQKWHYFITKSGLYISSKFVESQP